MKTHHFTIILSRAEESEDDAAALYEAGCDDGSISTSQGVTRIDFHREGVSLEAAIRSAIANVEAAGFAVSQVMIEPAMLAEVG